MILGIRSAPRVGLGRQRVQEVESTPGGPEGRAVTSSRATRPELNGTDDRTVERLSPERGGQRILSESNSSRQMMGFVRPFVCRQKHRMQAEAPDRQKGERRDEESGP
jgi:hypothetical protein